MGERKRGPGQADMLPRGLVMTRGKEEDAKKCPGMETDT
jgi:hypothetical protein